MFKLDNFGVILFVLFSYKKLLQCSFYENLKIDFSAKNSKKFVYYNEELVTNSKFQTQLSRKLQRFRTCRKNKKCSIFHDLSEYIIFSYDCNLLNWSFKNKRAKSWVLIDLPNELGACPNSSNIKLTSLLNFLTLPQLKLILRR